MVILQFNKFIRNKWAWGAVAVLFCVMFVGSDIVANLAGGGDASVSGAGKLSGDEVEFSEFNAFLSDEQLLEQRSRSVARSSIELNRAAWEACAAARVAKELGLEVSDQDLAETIESMFAAQGGFDFDKYRMLLKMNWGMTPETFEAHLRRQLLRDGLDRAVLGSAVWTSPMEVDQFVADMTDVFTVRVAEFQQSKAAADAVKVDANGLKKWYDANTNSIALPERTKIRFIRFNAMATNVLAKMVVTEDDMRDYYDANSEKYPSTDTNDVNGVKKFDVVKKDIENELRRIEAVNFFETNLSTRVFSDDPAFAKGQSRLDVLAKAENLSVQTSAWFSVEGTYVEGFMRPAGSILSGAKNFLEVVSELDSSVEDLRYGIVSSDRAVWLIEKFATDAAHVPTFDEAKAHIGARALRDARADAFKAEVEAIAAKGAKAVLATKSVSTNLTFCVSDMQGNTFKDQMFVVRAATKLTKGEVSKFTLTNPGRALLVVCEKRETGDIAKAVMMRSQIRDQATAAQQRALAKKWREWNLARMNLQTTDSTAVESVANEDEEE